MADKLAEKADLQHFEDGKTSPNSTPNGLASEDIEPELTLKTWGVVIAAVVGYLAGVIFLSGCGFWAAVIVAEVGNPELTIWIQQARALSFAWNPPVALLAPAVSRLGDNVGRRYIWLIANVFGMVGAILVATCQSAGAAIAGVTLFGIGFSNSGNVFAVPAEVLPRRHRGTAAMAVSLGGYSGSFIGIMAGASLITTNPGPISGFRSLFWIVFAAHVVSFVLVFFAYHPPPPVDAQHRSLTARLLDFDALGTVLYALATVPLLVALFAGGLTHPWSSPAIIAPLVVGCVFIFVFAAHQKWIKKDGLFDHGMFVSRNAALCLFCIAIEGFVYNAFTNFYGAQTGALYDPRPIFLGLRFSIFGFCAVAATPIWMWIAYRYKWLTEQLSAGFILFLIAVIGLATATPGSGKVVLFYVALAGVGFASPISVLLSVAQLAMPAHYAGQISGLMISVRSIGGSVGPAICSAVFTSKITTSLPARIAAAAAAAGLPAASIPALVGAIATSDTAGAAAVPGVTPEILGAAAQGAKEAYAYSFRFIWIVLAPFIVVSLIMCLCMESSKSKMTYVIDAPVENIHYKKERAAGQA